LHQFILRHVVAHDSAVPKHLALVGDEIRGHSG
jgi:hypothetical protein